MAPEMLVPALKTPHLPLVQQDAWLTPYEPVLRQRLLRLTGDGAALEVELFDALREKLSAAYARAGQQAVGGFWAVLEGLIPEGERSRLDALRLRD